MKTRFKINRSRVGGKEVSSCSSANPSRSPRGLNNVVCLKLKYFMKEILVLTFYFKLSFTAILCEKLHAQ